MQNLEILVVVVTSTRVYVLKRYDTSNFTLLTFLGILGDRVTPPNCICLSHIILSVLLLTPFFCLVKVISRVLLAKTSHLGSHIWAGYLASDNLWHVFTSGQLTFFRGQLAFSSVLTKSRSSFHLCFLFGRGSSGSSIGIAFDLWLEGCRFESRIATFSLFSAPYAVSVFPKRHKTEAPSQSLNGAGSVN